MNLSSLKSFLERSQHITPLLHLTSRSRLGNSRKKKKKDLKPFQERIQNTLSRSTNSAQPGETLDQFTQYLAILVDKMICRPYSVWSTYTTMYYVDTNTKKDVVHVENENVLPFIREMSSPTTTVTV